jgi:DNA recombination protein RmuC
MFLYFVAGSSTVAAILALLAFLTARSLRNDQGQLPEGISKLVRAECDHLRFHFAEQHRGMREELSNNLRSFQTATLQAFTDLGRQLGDQIREFGGTLAGGSRAIDERLGTLGATLDRGLAQIAAESLSSKEALEHTIAARLGDSATAASTAARELREEVSSSVAKLQNSLVAHLTTMRGDTAEQAQLLRSEVTSTLKQSSDAIIAGLGQISATQQQSLAEMATTANARDQAMVRALDEKIGIISNAASESVRELGEGLTENVSRVGNSLSETLSHLGFHQKERLEELTRALASSAEGQFKAQEALRGTIESRLDAIRAESASKLEEMRRAVDEKLQSALEQRLNESFRIVNEQLDLVYRALGEMRSLAAGVGDLKRVLTNVKVRGTWSEIQLGSLLEQFLAPDQYLRQVQIRDDSPERVEFAIRLPGRDGEREVLLPIDAKFPQEEYDRLALAAENADAAGVDEAAAALEARIRSCAKSIKEKYINPPLTTDIAILFLCTEGLYSEILRRPGLFDQLQREYQVTIAGPTTLTAILNALQMGFRSLAIEKRSTEVWQILGAIRAEFGKYGEVVERLHKQLNEAVNTVDSLGTRARVMNRKLQGVEILPDAAAQALLQAYTTMEDGRKDLEEAAPE